MLFDTLDMYLQNEIYAMAFDFKIDMNKNNNIIDLVYKNQYNNLVKEINTKLHGWKNFHNYFTTTMAFHIRIKDEIHRLYVYKQYRDHFNYFKMYYLN